MSLKVSNDGSAMEHSQPLQRITIDCSGGPGLYEGRDGSITIGYVGLDEPYTGGKLFWICGRLQVHYADILRFLATSQESGYNPAAEESCLLCTILG